MNKNIKNGGFNKHIQINNFVIDIKKIDIKILNTKNNKNRKELINKRKNLLEDIIICLKPLLLKSSKHFFGYINEDLIQEGNLHLIKLINKFDQSKNDNFIGYAKYMINAFYFDLKRKDSLNKKRNVYLDTNEKLDSLNSKTIEFEDSISNDLNLFELSKTLDENEKIIFKYHLLNNYKLKEIEKFKNIKYRKLLYTKKKLVDKLKNNISLF